MLKHRLFFYAILSAFFSWSALSASADTNAGNTRAETLSSSGSESKETFNIGLQMMADFEKLPYPKNFTAKHESSYDRLGFESDCDWFLNGTCLQCKQLLEGCIMMDADGPGVITRIWYTSHSDVSLRFNVYIDNDPHPVISCTKDELFDRQLCYPFEDLFVGSADSSAGGYYCYFPIPFTEHIKITATEFSRCGIYFNIDCLILPPGEEITSFSGELSPTDEEAVQKILNVWHNPGVNPIDSLGAVISDAVEVLANDTTTFAYIDGKRCITDLKILVSPSDSSVLRDLYLKIFWDEEEVASVNAPLGAFFGNGIKSVPFRSLALGSTDSGFYCYYPMPFHHSAQLQIDNKGMQNVSLSYQIAHKEVEEGQSFYKFRAAYNEQNPTISGINYEMLDLNGIGHYVGTALSILSGGDWKSLEGDEMFYLEGEVEPSIHGTGTEDYFNCGWYFYGQDFLELPYHGLPLLMCYDSSSYDYSALGYKSSYLDGLSIYRLHLSDIIPFTSSIKATFEHGPQNDVNANYRSVAYYYSFDCPTKTCGDVNCDFVVDIGDVVYLLNYLFKGHPPFVLPELGDVNTDLTIDLGDAIYLINYLFKGGLAPSC